jgi:hypothetical protein
MRRTLVGTVFVISISGCEKAEAPPSAAVVETTDSAGVQIVYSSAPTWERPWRISATLLFEVGRSGRGPEYELFRVAGARILSDGRLVIANAGTGELRWFTNRGAFIRSAGGEGEGPGEFRALTRLVLLSGDSIAVSDVYLGRISVFDAAGDFVHTISRRTAPVTLPSGRFEDGTYLLTPNGPGIGTDGPSRIERLSMTVDGLDVATGSEATIATLPWLEVVVSPAGTTRPDGTQRFQQVPRPFGLGVWVAAGARGWVVADNARNELEFRTPVGNVTRIARWSAPRRAVTEADVSADLERELSRRRTPEARELFRAFYDEYPPPPDSMPVFGCAYPFCTAEPMHLDPDGNVWLAQYLPPAEGYTTGYFVFDSTGAWLGTVATPPGLAILSVGRDRVVGKRTDDLGVESVSVHLLER